MTQIDPVKFFDKEVAKNYDTQATNMKAIVSNLHLLIELVLQNLPENARILCVGAGTGTEIIHLANAYPNWQFLAVEPSQDMLEVCKSKLKEYELTHRCKVVHGYLSDIEESKPFNAVLCLLVTQFILDQQERQEMFNCMANYLQPDGYLINAEISYDMQSIAFESMAEKWVGMQKKSGLTKEDVEKRFSMMKQSLAVVPPSDIESMIVKSGFVTPILFFQSLLIHAWYARK